MTDNATFVLTAFAAVAACALVWRLSRYVRWVRQFEGELRVPLNPLRHVDSIVPLLQGILAGDMAAPFVRAAAEGGPVTVLWLVGQPLVLVTSLPVMRALVQSGINGYHNPHTVERSPRQTAEMGAVFGKSLLFTQGHEWRWRRDTIMPFFQPRVLNRVAEPVVASFTAALIGSFRAQATAVDVDAAFVELTCKIITSVLLGADFDWERTPVGSARRAVECITEINDAAIANQSRAAASIPQLGTLSNNSAAKPKALLRDSLAPVIKQIRAANPIPTASFTSAASTSSDTLLEHLARNPDYTDELLVVEAIAMLLAGTETTAHTMAFALHELSKRPDLLQRLHDEAVDVFGDDRDAPLDITAATLSKLTFAGSVFKETLRLYPSVGMFIVRAVDRTLVGDHSVPAGADIILNVKGSTQLVFLLWLY